MLKEYHPINIVIGDDGSWVVEGIPEGRLGAEKVFKFLLGEVPAAGSFKTNPLWDWVYFPAGSLTDRQRGRVKDLAPVRNEGSWVIKVHEAPSVDVPGAYAERITDFLKDSWFGRIVAGIIGLLLVGGIGLFWLNSRQPAFVDSGLSDVVAASQATYVEPTFSDRLSTQFTDGAHFNVPFVAGDVFHRTGEGVILGSGSTAYLILSEGVGDIVANVLQQPGAALRFDTSRSGVRLEQPNGTWKSAMIHPLSIGNAPNAETAQSVRFDDPSTFQTGVRYVFEGGFERDGDKFVLFKLPQNQSAYRVEIAVEDPQIRSLLEYIASRNFGAQVYAELESLTPREARMETRVIGRAGSDLGIGFARHVFVPKS